MQTSNDSPKKEDLAQLRKSVREVCQDPAFRQLLLQDLGLGNLLSDIQGLKRDIQDMKGEGK